jgi:hypothetical protein
MKTTFCTGCSRRASTTWATISALPSWRSRPPRPVWQKVQRERLRQAVEIGLQCGVALAQRLRQKVLGLAPRRGRIAALHPVAQHAQFVLGPGAERGQMVAQRRQGEGRRAGAHRAGIVACRATGGVESAHEASPEPPANPPIGGAFGGTPIGG